jgi:uncharacterized protein (TIGR03437 family)
MNAIRVALAVVLVTLPFRMVASINPPALVYTTASIVNAASYSSAALAPNTIATIFGNNLSFSTEAVTAADFLGGALPTELDGVDVYIGAYSAGLFYVSPTQINLLLPNGLLPGTYIVTVIRNGFAGPAVPITLALTAPALFTDGFGNAIAVHLDGSLVTAASPGIPGDWVILYAVGLGRTVPDTIMFLAPTVAAPITNIDQFSLTFNGVAVPGSAIYYAGVTPGLAGLYQINLHIPADAPPKPQIVISIGSAASAPATELPLS